MIISFLLSIIYQFVNFLLSLLPTGIDFPQSWVQGVFTIWGYVNAFSVVVPVDTIVFCLGVAMAFHLFVLAWKLVHWVYGLIRGHKYH